MSIEKKNKELLRNLVSVIEESRKRVAFAINSELTLLYWNIGKLINDDILNNERAEYGQKIIEELSAELTNRYGKGFSKRNIHNFLKFNEIFQKQDIVQTLSAQLTWSHEKAIELAQNNL